MFNLIIEQQLEKDISLLEKEKADSLVREIKEFIDKENIIIPHETSSIIIKKVLATYATSHTYFGPVITEWAACLLERGLKEERQLIFLARDGIAPYLAAQILKKQHAPKYEKVVLSLLPISRTLAYSSTQLDEKICNSEVLVKEYVQRLKKRDPYLLQKYIIQETGMQRGARCLFIDIGFSGSLITPITEQLEHLDIDMRFHYLISHTSRRKVKRRRYEPRAFLAHKEKRPLAVVDKAGGNPAVHWMEDTHQSVYASPKILIQEACGQVLPGILKKDDEGTVYLEKGLISCKHNPEEFLMKTFGLKAVVDVVKAKGREFTQPSKEASEERRQHFTAFLEEFHQERKLLIRH